MSNPFGWSYPAGAENDPAAPYNERDEDDGPTREEREIDMADMAMDLAKDEE